jgi:MFS family permease
MSEAPTLRDRLASWFATPLDADFRSAEHLERERWLLFAPSVAGVASPRFRRVYAVPAAFLAQLCVGSFYSTSIFNKWSDSHVWGAPGSNAGGFTACVAMYGLCSILLGAYITRNGAFRSTRIALVATPLGWLLMSLALRSRQLALLYGGYGVLHGLGCALTYLATTSMLQGWFPELKGLMSGIAVCGAGVGSYLWTSLGRALLDPAGAYRLMITDARSFALPAHDGHSACATKVPGPPGTASKRTFHVSSELAVARKLFEDEPSLAFSQTETAAPGAEPGGTEP